MLLEGDVCTNKAVHSLPLEALWSTVLQEICSKSDVSGIFCDVSETFGHVNRGILMTELPYHRMNGNDVG